MAVAELYIPEAWLLPCRMMIAQRQPSMPVLLRVTAVQYTWKQIADYMERYITLPNDVKEIPRLAKFVVMREGRVYSGTKTFTQ